MNHQELSDWCVARSLPALLYPSRIHAVDSWGEGIWIKREDESGFLGGTKRRKYASLLYFAKAQGYKKLRIIGGANSNHVPSLLSLAKQDGFACELWLKASNQPKPRGTALISLLLNGGVPIRWLDNEEWNRVDEIAQEDCPSDTLVVPEGACCLASWPGALSLAADIVRNEEALNVSFEHVWVDAGTGLTAAALGLGLGLLGRFPRMHVMLAAGTEVDFLKHLSLQVAWAKAFPELGDPLSIASRLDIKTHKPVSARAFGSVNATVKQACMSIAAETGILVDPIYTGKLVMTMQEWVQKTPPIGEVLMIHGGGLVSLTGFADAWDISWL